MNKKLNGYTLKFSLEASCPIGHKYCIECEKLVVPDEEFTDNEFNSLKFYLKRMHHELSKTECEKCIKSNDTGWR